MKLGRHAKSSWDWGTEPSRSDEKAAAIAAELGEPRPVPGKKDRKGRCKVAKGAHILAKTKRLDLYTCRYSLIWNRAHQKWDIGWNCFHEVRCSACGKVFASMVSDEECPDWRILSKSRREELSEQIALREEARTRNRRVQPKVTGPQHYRRPKKV
jgi:hypothetical protein